MADDQKFQTLVTHNIAKTYSADPDQVASEDAVWSGSFLFAILTSILMTNIIFENGKGKVFEILEHLS